jgi:hypothetical protein
VNAVGIDVLYGWTAPRPEWACRIVGAGEPEEETDEVSLLWFVVVRLLWLALLCAADLQ